MISDIKGKREHRFILLQQSNNVFILYLSLQNFVVVPYKEFSIECKQETKGINSEGGWTKDLPNLWYNVGFYFWCLTLTIPPLNLILRLFKDLVSVVIRTWSMYRTNSETITQKTVTVGLD